MQGMPNVWAFGGSDPSRLLISVCESVAALPVLSAPPANAEEIAQLQATITERDRALKSRVSQLEACAEQIGQLNLDNDRLSRCAQSHS